MAEQSDETFDDGFPHDDGHTEDRSSERITPKTRILQKYFVGKLYRC